MNNDSQLYQKKRIPTWLSVLLIRWWSAGAVFFFIGWGTRLSFNSDPFDLIFVLGFIMGIITAFVLNSLFKQVFNYGWHKTYQQSTVASIFLYRLSEVIIALTTVILVFGVYYFINETIMNVWEIDRTVEGNGSPLKMEPILFGLFYALIAQAIMFVILKIRQRRT